MVEKLSQNIQALVGEIGERQVLLRLAILSHQRSEWQVFLNLGESGYDVLLLNTSTDERICVEVKTRQRLYTTGKLHRPVQFNLTDGEYEACDVLIAYFIDHNDFYIVPKSDLKPVSGGKRWRFVLTMNKQGRPHPRFSPYRNNWGLLHPDFDGEELQEKTGAA